MAKRLHQSDVLYLIHSNIGMIFNSNLTRGFISPGQISALNQREFIMKTGKVYKSEFKESYYVPEWKITRKGIDFMNRYTTKPVLIVK